MSKVNASVLSLGGRKHKGKTKTTQHLLGSKWTSKYAASNYIFSQSRRNYVNKEKIPYFQLLRKNEHQVTCYVPAG